MARASCCTLERILRKKTYGQHDHPQGGNLKRCLSVWDLTSLSVGSTLGVGVYIIIGTVASQLAGPSVVLSFLIAAIVSSFAGLCYSELGCRLPRAGSAFIYTYIAIGELPAFIIGWNMILEGFIGSASFAKGLSLFIDDLSNNTISTWSLATVPINTGFFSPYFDTLAFFIVLVLGVILLTGARPSSILNMLFVMISMVIILIVIIAGSVKADVNNWYLTNDTLPIGFGEGGFFPYGVWGTLKGAAVCFYGFVGFDTVASAAEEVRDRQRALPISILSSIAVLCLVYTSVSIVSTMVLPYYLQESTASVVQMFQYVGWEWARWTASIGFIAAIFSSFFGSIFPVGRLLYAMASENLAPKLFSRIQSRIKLPLIAILISASIIAILSSVLDLNQMVLMMCLGTLFSYTSVAISVIALRYESNFPLEFTIFKQLLGCGGHAPSRQTAIIVYVLLFLYVLTCIVMALVGVYLSYPLIPMVVLHGVAITFVIIMALQPTQKEDLYFKAPLVPLVPCLSIYFNINLMVLISWETWVRLLAWMIIGIFVYLTTIYCSEDTSGKTNEDDLFTIDNIKDPVQIVVQNATPSDSMQNNESVQEEEIRVETKNEETIRIETENEDKRSTDEVKDIEHIDKNEIVLEEVLIKQAVVEHTEEKEAKIIDLLDQVLQAAEATYEDMTLETASVNDATEVAQNYRVEKDILLRKSLSEISDAGSEVSLPIQVLAKYDVVAEIHREDLPKVKEIEENEENSIQENNDYDQTQYIFEKQNHDDVDIEQIENIEPENTDKSPMFYIDSETASRTDESGYSDTTDRNQLHESMEFKEDIRIPSPPPMIENLLASPIFKSYTISARSPKPKFEEEKEEPRESVQSNGSSEDNIVFGSSRQRNFMSKLNDIFQNKKPPLSEGSSPEIVRKRSNSTSNATEVSEIPAYSIPRPALFLDLKKELLAKNNITLKHIETKPEVEGSKEEEPVEENLTKEDLKSKLENLLSTGGPKLLKPRPAKSNPPTPDSGSNDSGSEENVKLPKIEKNDTLSKQKAKFGEVLKSFRLSINQDDNF